MKRVSVWAVSILAVLLLVGFTMPVYAGTVDDCFKDWKKDVKAKCFKEDKEKDKEKCFSKWRKDFNKCLKKAEGVDGSKYKELKKCLNKEMPKSKKLASKKEKALKKELKNYKAWAKTCKKKAKIK